MEFKVGGGQVIPDFKQTVIGLEPGEPTSIGIPANEAYGPYQDELTQEIPKSCLPGVLAPEIDQRLVTI